MTNAAPGPLVGVRVLDLTQQIAGPYCTKLFADYGAEVIKIEPPDGGDPTRRLGPFLHDEPNLEKSGLFLHLNTNKKSVTLDIETQAGRNVLLQLTRDADIVVESFTPDFMPSLDLDYDAFEAVNPRTVMTSISNFGRTGPYKDYAASEITLYALGGTMISTGLAERPPVKLGLTVEQFYAGMVCATATMGAFMGASLTGEGQHVDMSLMEIMVANQDRAVQGHMIYQYTGPGPGRTGAGNPGRTIVPVGVYPTLDGYVQFFALTPRWDRICAMIDRPDLVNDPHFTAPENFAGNAEVKEEFDGILLEWLLTHTKREVMELSQAAGHPCGAINTLADVFEDPHLEARGFFQTIDHPATGPLKYPGPQFRMSETPWRAGRAPLLGEHTSEVLQSLGYSADDIARLREQGAL
jgi:crotonobetainyl-CoA:carnitine CoA-transferase CaiB-like acyl-CoA transferase